MEVQDGSGDELQPLTSHISAGVPSLPPTVKTGPISVGGRRLREDLVEVPAGSPQESNQSSVSALGRRDGAADVCKGSSWDLSLSPGQNDFRITATRKSQPVGAVSLFLT